LDALVETLKEAVAAMGRHALAVVDHLECVVASWCDAPVTAMIQELGCPPSILFCSAPNRLAGAWANYDPHVEGVEIVDRTPPAEFSIDV